MADNNKVSRRGFLDLLQIAIAATGVAAIVGPIIAFFWPADLEEVPSEPVAVGPEDSIPIGTAKTIRFGRYPAIVLNTEDGLRAYSAVCTHFACIVTWEPENNRLACPCHAGYFEPMDGSVISGPPPNPLEPIPVFNQDGTLFIGGEL
jgi:cytochrome b6-f complex iron-sulfur subunit